MLNIPPADLISAEAARARLNLLAKPPGSLGRLEDLAVALAASQGRALPTADRPQIIVFAADHGVARAQAVSPYPPEVTALMVQTFASGRAAVSALARVAGAGLEVVELGVVQSLPLTIAPGVRVVRESIAPGTNDLSVQAAMSPGERDAAMGLGREAVLRAVADTVDVLALGEMGIGNTTAAAALAARLLGRRGAELAGPGTGLDAAGVSHKAAVIQRGLDRNGPGDPLGALADLGGLEIAALVGGILEAAARRVPVVLDGFIVSVAALVAVRLNPNVRAHLIPATRSAEPGHGVVLDALGLGPPLLDWGLRLGEGSAAALTLPLCRAACAALRDMATLEEVLGGR